MNDCSYSRRRTRGDCSRGRKALQTIDSVVQDYIDNHRLNARESLKHFSDQPNLNEAIRTAALAINRRGKRHSHQRRIPAEMLEAFRRGLSRKHKVIESCKTFPDLMEVSRQVASGIWKHSELTTYDTTHRIGSFLGIQPDRVYLHTGTREGAKALGFKGKKEFLFLKQLPRPFRRLEPHEVEDCLCIYKKDLRSIARQQPQS